MNSVEFWAAMQVAMVAGFLTSYPVKLVACERRHQGADVKGDGPAGYHEAGSALG